LLVTSVGALVGCSGSSTAAAPRAAAEAFERALTAGDGTAACRLLAPDTRSAVVQNADGPCPHGLGEERLPPADHVLSTEVWGRAAQVRLDGDTVFLSRFPGGWKVLAAGCTSRPEAPYDCKLAAG
jgi:hypothetical protein